MHELTASIVQELDTALKLYGTYSFDDKGPSETMLLEEMRVRLRAMPAEEAAAVLIELDKQPDHDGRCARVAGYLLWTFEDWDDLWAVPGIDELDY